ncbi:carboxypeptidase regulatory-like domain-containing protein [Candidatus Poribacteria bacterium]|nr:carboxypeptidase regulatory-like domain-containing protein [Candidatus Poribacteria bacterium]
MRKFFTTTINKYFYKSLVYLAILCLMVVLALSANADWFHDFEGPLPPSFITMGLTLGGAPSPTFSASVDGGFLTLSDPVPADDGGSWEALGAELSEEFSNVRVTGTVNVNGKTANDAALLARGKLATLSCYSATIEFTSGVLYINKIIGGSSVDAVFSNQPDQGSQPPLTELGRSYFLQFNLVGNLLTARVFDHKGGKQLLVVNYTDTGVVGPPFTSGLSGLGASANLVDDAYTPIDATFDNVASTALSETVINGRVTDTDGIPLKALVIAINLETKEKSKAVPDVSGGYSISDLQQGDYLVLATKSGYKTGVKKVVVETGKATTVIFKLIPK